MTHKLNAKTPWFNSETLEFLSSLLKPDWTVLETGCGSSTVWYLSRVKNVVSFEHDWMWFYKTMMWLKAGDIENTELHYCPDYPIKGIGNLSGLINLKENEFDFISIDGRGRVKSIETAIPYLKSGGYLMLDDSQRERYQQAFTLVDNWDYETLGKNEKKATIWKKP